MKKMMNIMVTVLMVMLTLCSWALGAVMAYFIAFEGLHFSIDFSTVEAGVETVGELMLTAIPCLGMLATVCKLKAITCVEKKVKKVQTFRNMELNARIG